MSRGAYYNDNEPFVAAWLRNLIAAGELPAGDVDERPIQAVRAADLAGYTQCHFFAGIGGWAYALRLARWPDDRPVWTGSCPCQPFSAAGKRQAGADARHLWPAWLDLIRECRPGVVFGEQVSGAVGLGWLDAVALDLEAEGYAVGAVILGAHSVGAYHKRQRLYFVADSDGTRRGAGRSSEARSGRDAPRLQSSGLRPTGELADRLGAGLEGHAGDGDGRDEPGRLGAGAAGSAPAGGAPGELADAERAGPPEGGPEPRNRPIACGGESGNVGDAQGERRARSHKPRSDVEHDGQQSAQPSPWANADWLPCRDGKWRPTEPGLFPLAHGIPARVGRLRAYGNAVVPQAAAAFVSAYMDSESRILGA